MKNEAYEQWAEFTKSATEPMLKLNEISAKALEQVTRYQFDIAKDYMDLGTRQMELLSKAKDPQVWVTEEGQLVNEFSKRLMSRAEAFVELASETQKAMAGWAEEAANKAKAAAESKTKAA